ncbi:MULTISPECIES: hypothetical protein [Treponema]|uniref:Uncharacterized protein n=1 Tax=Treponema denticola TaxID=158 RepID=A0A9Q9BHU3_TREDN|nr:MULTISPECIES: hypothetical protein [Treponema]EGC76288.1 hypothetical protein HMPREF9353_02603 [Treponema denticola F0402]EGC76835.1 hypothetical protein HMPREF9353_01937 [Treponema denticola F0402]UTC90383.1 hypothetical protein E4N87_06625 [Treponema denticola]UTD00265.1 hypothetical protein E4N86_05950 [Treponema denticola]UTD09747.1 hypothetical protein HYB91_04155 [Treponema sp. B152]
MKNTPLLKMKGITKDDGIILNDGLILDGISDSLNDEKAWDDGIKPMGDYFNRDPFPISPPSYCCCGGGSGSIITEKEIIL